MRCHGCHISAQKHKTSGDSTVILVSLFFIAIASFAILVR